MNDTLILVSNDMYGQDRREVVVNLRELQFLSQWFTLLQCGGEKASSEEENGAWRHVSTPTLKSIYKKGGLSAKNG